MNTTDYWNKAALDPDVDNKYICDIDTELCLKDLGQMNGDVLEIGCGVGRLMKAGYWGVDISIEMISIANKRKPECGFKHMVNGVIPFDDNEFDHVYSYLVFQHLKPDEVQQYMNEAHRVLRSKGQFQFQYIDGTEREPLSNHYKTSELMDMMTNAGFKSVWYQQSVAHELWWIMGGTI